MASKLFLTGVVVFIAGFFFALISPKEAPLAYRATIGFMLLGGIALGFAALLVMIWS